MDIDSLRRLDRYSIYLRKIYYTITLTSYNIKNSYVPFELKKFYFYRYIKINHVKKKSYDDCKNQRVHKNAQPPLSQTCAVKLTTH